MSPNILFQIGYCTTIDDVWTKLEYLFGKQDAMRGHMLEVELTSLDLRNFDNIHDLFMKFKTLLLHIKICGIDKSTQHNQLILDILVKLGLDYVVSISSFHANKFTLGET
jgi:hypothetical protein